MKARILITVFLSFLLFNSYGQVKKEAIENLVDQFHKYNKFSGTIIIANDKEIIYKDAIGLANREWNIPHKLEGKFVIGSLSKQFVAALTLIYNQEGKIDLNIPIIKYIPELPNSDILKSVTIHHLLSSTSGLPHYNAWDDFLENKDRLTYSKEDLLKMFKEVELEFEPGARHRYSSLGYLILGYILENVGGNDLATLLSNKILSPCNMSNTLLPKRDEIIPQRVTSYRYNYSTAQYDNANYRDPSTTFSAGGIISTVSDLLIWDRILKGNTILTDASKQLLFNPVDRNYAYGWRTMLREDMQVLWHAGQSTGYKSMMARLPETGYSIIILSNIRDMPHVEITNQIINILFDNEVTYPKKSLLKTLLKEIVSSDVIKAIDLYFNIKENHFNEYSFSETELLILGMELNSEKMFNEAIEILKLNLKENTSYRINNFLLLGRNYEAVNKTKEAILNYEEALKIDPSNERANERLKALKG